VAGLRKALLDSVSSQDIAEVAETLVRDLVEQVRHTQKAERRMRKLLDEAFEQLP
jgi:Na+/pantothenate symporter